jgi:uroporphyrinogen decarboxylase
MSETPAAPRRHLLLRAIAGEAVERPPVWAMRQAGRWDPEFNRLRGSLSFYEFADNAPLAAEASLLPRRFGVDAIILFYDITTLAAAMGLPFRLVPGRGPVPDGPVRSRADVNRLTARPDADGFRAVLDVLAFVKRSLAGALPVLVFAGAPFTLATYCVGTGKDLAATRAFATAQPGTWDHLLGRLQEATVHFLGTLAAAGADAYQLFDSWAGALTADEYRRWAQLQHRAIFAAVRGLPSILFVREGPYLEDMVQTGADVVSLGVRHDLAEVKRRYPNQVFQGNVDEDLLRTGTPEQVAAATRACVAAGGGRRHVVNLNHGVDRATPPTNVAAYVQAVLTSTPAGKANP